MTADGQPSQNRRRRLRALVLAPLLGLTLLVGSFSAGATPPDRQGPSGAEGRAAPKPSSDREAPQGGRPAGKATGRRTH